MGSTPLPDLTWKTTTKCQNLHKGKVQYSNKYCPVEIALNIVVLVQEQQKVASGYMLVYLTARSTTKYENWESGII